MLIVAVSVAFLELAEANGACGMSVVVMVMVLVSTADALFGGK